MKTVKMTERTFNQIPVTERAPHDAPASNETIRVLDKHGCHWIIIGCLTSNMIRAQVAYDTEYEPLDGDFNLVSPSYTHRNGKYYWQRSFPPKNYIPAPGSIGALEQTYLV